MKTLALDISTTTTGYAILNERGALLKSGQFHMKDRGLSDTRYAHAITEKVVKLIKTQNIGNLSIEDVYYGKNIKNVKTWCRVHGAVANYWYKLTEKEPIYMMASSARSRNGLHSQCKKIEVQLAMSHEFGLVDPKIYYSYCGKLGKLLQQKENKSMSKNKFDYQMNKISKAFEDETGISEHIADAILLGKSTCK